MGTVIALGAAIAFIVLATARWNIHAYLALLLAALGFGLAAGLAPLDVVAAANQGFGATVGNIGAVVILGGIIGVFLERTGGALRIAEAVLKLTGPKNIPGAMAGVGYVVSIPVFCDTGFVILSSLNRALSKRAGVTIASGALALALGLYATHTLVPPTPGPVAAAGILGADLGLVIAVGIVISALALIPGWLFATFVAGRVYIAPDASARTEEADAALAAAKSERPPGVAHAMTPILAPLFLIVLGSIANLPARPFGDGVAWQVIAFLGSPTIALLLGAALAMSLPRRFSLALIAQESWVGDAIKTTAIILIVTGAGGAFAGVLAKTDIGATLGGLLAGGGAQFGLFVPFAVAALIKTAQGSSTVAMITAAGIVLPILPALGLDSDMARALATIAVGAGAMMVSHANDSYFWVVTQFSGMSARQGFQLHTLGTLIQGTAAGALVWAAGGLLL